MKNELEKVSKIQVHAKLLDQENVSDMSNTVILVGMSGLVVEASMQRFNLLISAYFAAIIIYGVTAGILRHTQQKREFVD